MYTLDIFIFDAQLDANTPPPPTATRVLNLYVCCGWLPPHVGGRSRGGGGKLSPPQGGKEVGKVLLIMWGVGAISVVERCVAVLLFLFLDFKLGPDCYC